MKKRFLGNVTVVSPVHVSTEGCYGISLWTPDDVSETQFVIHPTANFYEFIPEDELDKDSPDTVLAHEVCELSCDLIGARVCVSDTIIFER